MNPLISLACLAIDEKKGTNISVIDISGISSIADYFIIASGSNIRQIHSIYDHVTEVLARNGYNYKSAEGVENGSWILLDYGDVIIHIFNEDERRFYDLERLWRDGKLLSRDEIEE